MCQFFSFVTALAYPAGPDVSPELTYYWLDRDDSHSTIIDHYKLREDALIQWEYVPDNHDKYVSSTTTYHLVVDKVRCKQVSPEHLEIIKLDVMAWLSTQDLKAHAIRRGLWIEPYTSEELAKMNFNDLLRQRRKHPEVMVEITRRATNDQLTNTNFLLCYHDLDKDLQAKYIARLSARQCVHLYNTASTTMRSALTEIRPEIMKFDLVRYLAGECRRDPVQTVTLSEISRVLREADPTLTRDVVALLICVPQIRHQLRDRHNLSSVVLDRVNDLVGGLKILREYRGWMGNGHYNIIAPAEVQQFLRRAGVKIGATIYDTRPDPAIEKLQGTVLNVIDKRPFVHVSKTTKLPHWTRVGRYYGKRTSEQRYTLISSVVFTLADGTNLSLI